MFERVFDRVSTVGIPLQYLYVLPAGRIETNITVKTLLIEPGQAWNNGFCKGQDDVT